MPKQSPQSGVAPGSADAFPSTLTLRIYHDKTSFTATFRERFTQDVTNENKCSCQRIRHVWIGADNRASSQQAALFPEPPRRTTIMRFFLLSPANKDKARDLCATSQRSLGSVPFRKGMQALMTALADLCEAPHVSSQAKSMPTPSSVLRPMRTTGLDRNTVSNELVMKIANPLVPSEEKWGYIYILRSQRDWSTMSVLKIGFSKYHPEHRSHELANCLSTPEVIAHTPLIPHAKRIETLIHAELIAKRKVQQCGQCGQKHGEWFTVSHADAREIVIR